MQRFPIHSDVIIIGAGPSGSAMASWLANRGLQALIIEKGQFPRFSIGESLLPEAINCLEQVGLLDTVESGGFQYKDGATFATNNSRFDVNFSDSFSTGKSYAFQVPRADFDHRLVNHCISKGVEICYQTEILNILPVDGGYRLMVQANEERQEITTRFLVDASGFGRVLAKAFNLDKPSGLADKKALFCHMEADFEQNEYDRKKILIAQIDLDIPQWFWLIPFTGKHCSVGVVTDHDDSSQTLDLESGFRDHISRQHMLSSLVGEGLVIRKVGSLSGYSASISRLYGNRFAILGNAGEFIDPIFSSGVTIALKSALLAAPLVLETVKYGKHPDWETRFQQPLMEGVNTFKEYVLAWYAGTLPRLFHSSVKDDAVYRMICGILAGYVWDRNNPFTRMTASRLKSLTC